MTTKTKKPSTTRKKAASQPKSEAVQPAETMEQVQQPDSVPTCPECSSPMVRRSGRFGEFWGCSRFASGECKATVKIEK